MRTLDRNYLANHPVGDEKAEIVMHANVPDTIDVADNPDGTRPKITIKAVGDNYMHVLTALSMAHDENPGELALELTIAEAAEQLEAFDNLDEAIPTIREIAKQVVTPFRTFSIVLGLTETGDDGAEKHSEVELHLTAPSISSAESALKALTRPHVLTQVAIGFSPETDDDEFDDEIGSNEVLFVS